MNRNSNISRILPVVWLEGNETVDAHLQRLREQIARTHPVARDGQAHLVRLALNEAEALAWQTAYPHLFFPLLAEEKIAQLQRWKSRQEAVWGETQELAFAA